MANPFTLFVDNLPLNISQNWLIGIFSNYGHVRDCFIPKSIRPAKPHVRDGFVRFASMEEAKSIAHKANGNFLLNHKLFVTEAYCILRLGVMQLLLDHDWLRALRMTSYGFLLYGPGSFAWYQQLDRSLPKPTMKNLLMKILLNQIILGPCVIAVVFAWNNLWLRKLSELPKKYKNDAFPTLLSGFKFWIPMSALNFWYICPFPF